MSRQAPRTTAIVLAGTLRPWPLREALAVPELCLPLDHERCLLHAWSAALRTIEPLREIAIVVNEQDVPAVEGSLLEAAPTRARRRGSATATAVHIVAEPASWRGPAGILRDVSEGLDDDDVVVALEAACLPPRTLRPLLGALRERDGRIGVVGTCGRGEPAGVCAFRRRALAHVPAIGYFDLKEQLLPALYAQRESVGTIALGEGVWRLRDRASYLDAVRRHLEVCGEGPVSAAIAPDASVPASVRIDGFCVIARGAVIEDGAVVHDSVIMAGASVGGGAIVSRSIVGSGGRVPPRGRLWHAVERSGLFVAPSPFLAPSLRPPVASSMDGGSRG